MKCHHPTQFIPCGRTPYPLPCAECSEAVRLLIPADDPAGGVGYRVFHRVALGMRWIWVDANGGRADVR